ncbi:MAG: sulfatase-like hydrolase/transferase [Rubripirellula sp.]|nr:sulfatase-like hydrolase/transferase [Rubripirellula sp.]
MRLLLLSALMLFPGWGLATETPNIVYIMADELGYYELSCLGNATIQTPRIDEMASQGIRFTQALAGSSVCAPTRCCLMTGKHSGHTSVRSNGGGTPLRSGELTIASILKARGYATGGFGKWGCGGRGSTGVPEEHGFDVFFGYYDQVHAHSYYPPYLVRNSDEVPLKGNRGLSDGETYSHDVIYKAALEFIRSNRDQPFFCYMPITPPHGIFDIPDGDPAWELYRDKPWPEQAKRYAAMVSMVDRQVGEVLDQLAELGLEEDTLVVFCGDNGGNDYFRDADHPRGFHGANRDPLTGVEFRGTKGTLYEGGLRIPMVMRWPGKIAASRVSNLLWYFPDVMPTIAELTGASTPDDIDGISIVPELIGEEAAGRKQSQHQYLYWELGDQIAVREESWKAVRSGRGGWELYDLRSDPSEAKEVSAKYPSDLKRLQNYADEAHVAVVTGSFHNPALHERDRQAKFGGRPKRRTQANALPIEGLVPNRDFRIVRVSSQAGANRVAEAIVDGDPRTHWHSSFSPKVLKHPHEVVIDLGKLYTISGFRYLARQDGGWNGAVKDCEFYLATDLETWGEPIAKTTFKKIKQAQEVDCEATAGRYLRIRVLSEVNSGPWASISELGIVGQ